MRVVSEFLEMEWNPTELIVNGGRIHPGTNRKRVGTHSSVVGPPYLTAQEMASQSLLRILTITKLISPKIDFTRAVVSPKSSSDVIHARRWGSIARDDNRQGRPDVQHITYRPCLHAAKSQCMPRIYTECFVQIELEYF